MSMKFIKNNPTTLHRLQDDFQVDHSQEFEYDAIRRERTHRYAHGPIARYQTRHWKLPRPLQENLQVNDEVKIITPIVGHLQPFYASDKSAFEITVVDRVLILNNSVGPELFGVNRLFVGDFQV